METLGIYISVPFCRSKCSYCNFASGVFPESDHEGYIERVIADIRSIPEQPASFRAKLPRAVDSVYLGGGTPSILSPRLIRRLFAVLREEFAIQQAAEITLECAPGQIEDEVLAAMVESGVNRVSFGVQSFVDCEAAVSGRLHDREVALRDIDRVIRAGVRSANADLIAGLPHQTPESWRESLEVLVDSGVDHASIYMLEVDEDSRLGRELIDGGGRYHAGAVPSEDMVAEFYIEAVERLARGGFAQYEISNFARPGGESIHNKRYWQRRPYIGFGLDAHSMLRGINGGAVRFQVGDHLQAFLEGAGFQDFHEVSRQQELEEAWFLGLRLNDGVAVGALEREFGEPEVSGYRDLVSELASFGLLQSNEGRISLTERGRLLSNEVFGRFLRSDEVGEEMLVSVD